MYVPHGTRSVGRSIDSRMMREIPGEAAVGTVDEFMSGCIFAGCVAVGVVTKKVWQAVSSGS